MDLDEGRTNLENDVRLDSSLRISIQNSISEKDFVEEEDGYVVIEERILDQEQTILNIKEHLKEPNQSEENLVHLLETLGDMDITFEILKETEIGRSVNRLRKNTSDEVKRLVKQLVRKWKDLVDEWLYSHYDTASGGGGGGGGASALTDEHSPPQNQP